MDTDVLIVGAGPTGLVLALWLSKLGIRVRILDVVTPLLQSREGEFNFILSEQVSALDIEYDPDTLLKEGGFPPPKILGSADGEKI